MREQQPPNFEDSHIYRVDGSEVESVEVMAGDYANEQILGAIFLSEKASSSLNDIARYVRDFLATFQGIKDVGSIDAQTVGQLGIDVCQSPDILQAIYQKALDNSNSSEISLDDYIKTAYQIEFEKMHDDQAEMAGAELAVLGFDSAEINDCLERGLLEEKRLIISLSRILKSPGMEKLAAIISIESAIEPISLAEGIARARGVFHRTNRQLDEAKEGRLPARRAINELARSSAEIRESIIELEFES